MEENKNTTNTTSENEASKPVKEKKENSKKDGKKSINSFIAAHKAEFRMITWPNRQQVIKQTATVIVLSLVIGAIIFGYDEVFKFAYEKIIGLVS